MKIIMEKKSKHADYVDVTKSKFLIRNAGKECNQRDLPCGKNSR